jgi:hypothetical protein
MLAIPIERDNAICGVCVWYMTLYRYPVNGYPAVYDGLTARIRKCVAFPGLTNCGGVLAWEWSVAE